jgi:hypothetical protein
MRGVVCDKEGKIRELELLTDTLFIQTFIPDEIGL